MRGARKLITETSENKMIVKMFTVYDSKAELYLPPFYNQTTGQAVRAFGDTCNQKDHPFNKHPEDYTLFELGTFDDNTAIIVSNDAKTSLGTAIEYKADAELPARAHTLGNQKLEEYASKSNPQQVNLGKN